MEFIYEDGLRLSELYGQLAGAEYALEHIWTVKFGEFFFVAFLWVAIFCAIYALMYNSEINRDYFRDASDGPKDTSLYTWTIPKRTHNGYYVDKVWKPWVKFVPLIICGVVIIITEVITFIILQDMMTRDILQIQTQIDAILSKYQ